jgi:hypothetical protein
MRFFVTPTMGFYFLHIYYKDEDVHFKVQIGTEELVPEEQGTGRVGHISAEVTGFQGWVDIHGSGKLLAVVFSMMPELDEEFAQSLRATDVTQINDEKLLVLASTLAGLGGGG